MEDPRTDSEVKQYAKMQQYNLSAENLNVKSGEKSGENTYYFSVSSTIDGVCSTRTLGTGYDSKLKAVYAKLRYSEGKLFVNPSKRTFFVFRNTFGQTFCSTLHNDATNHPTRPADVLTAFSDLPKKEKEIVLVQAAQMLFDKNGFRAKTFGGCKKA